MPSGKDHFLQILHAVVCTVMIGIHFISRNSFRSPGEFREGVINPAKCKRLRCGVQHIEVHIRPTAVEALESELSLP